VELAVCDDCLGTWDRAGRRCARCWTPIEDRLQIGLCAETWAFVHVDCGGARVIGDRVGARS
jgi:hypothetical protein